MKYLALLAISLLTSTLLAEENQKLTTDQIKQYKVYENVEVNELEALPTKQPEESQHPTKSPQEIDPSIKKQAVSNLSTTLKKLTDSPIPKLKIQNGYDADTTITLSGRNEHCFIYATFDSNQQISYLSLSQNTPPLSGDKMTSKESFQTYATKIYQLIHNTPPLGTASFHHDGDGLTRAWEEEGCHWHHTISGVQIPELGGTSLKRDKRDGYFNWLLNFSKGATTMDVKHLEDHLSKHPVNLTKEEAYAIAVKASDQLGITHESKDTWITYSLTFQTLQPSMPVPTINGENSLKQWKQKNTPSLSLTTPIYCTKVTLSEGLNLNEFFLDWTTKKIIHVNSYRQSW
ncbi:MAG: hypothetical protein ACSHX6_07675 [Akkermansiaceae bacterium]